MKRLKDIAAWAIVAIVVPILLTTVGAIVWLLYEGHYIVIALILTPTAMLWALRRLDPPREP